MKDPIKWLSLVLAIVGIAGLWFVSAGAEPLKIGLSSITEAEIGKYVQVTGMVSRITEVESGYFMTLEDNGEAIKTIFWKSSGISMDGIEKGSSVDVTGRVALYQGELEIIADGVSAV